MNDWAKEQILERIAKATESSADSLGRMLAGNAAGLGKLNQGLGKAGKAADENAKKNRSLSKSLGDLSTTLQRENAWRSASWRRFGSELTSSSNQIQRLGSGLVGMFDRVAVIGPVVGLFAGAAVGLIQSVMGVKDAFIGLVDTGILFSGSLVDFRVAMGNAGITAEQFASIVSQSGQAIQIFGERRFLDSTNRLRMLFDELGLNLAQGNEYFGEYLENSRLSGALYFQSQEQQRQGFEANLRQMREQARLTGINVRQQRDQQRALRQETEYQLLLRSVSPERAAEIQRQEAAITTVAGSEFAKEFMTYAERGILRQGGFIATAQTLGLGEELNRLAQRARQGEQLDPAAFQAAIMRVPRELIATLQARSLSGDRLAQQFMQMRLAAEARQGITGVRGTEGGLDQLTQAMITMQNNLNQLMSQFNAKMIELGSKVLPIVLPYLESFNRAMTAFTTARPGEGLEQLAAQLQMGPELINVLRTFRTEGLISGMRAAISASASALWEGLTATLSAFATSFMNQLRVWRDEFITALSNLIPSWMRSRTIPSVESRDIVPNPVSPVSTTTPIPVRPPQAEMRDILTAEQFAILREREQEIGRLAGELLNMARQTRLTSEQNERLIRLQEQQYELQERMLNAEVDGLNGLRREIIRSSER